MVEQKQVEMLFWRLTILKAYKMATYWGRTCPEKTLHIGALID